MKISKVEETLINYWALLCNFNAIGALSVIIPEYLKIGVLTHAFLVFGYLKYKPPSPKFNRLILKLECPFLHT